MKKILLYLLLWTFPCSLIAQVSSHNGYYFSPRGTTIRAFMVFAEVLNDPLDSGALGNWQPGQMPTNMDDFVDANFTNPGSIHGYMTKYFHEASFGELIVLGDYYPHLIQIDYNNVVGSGHDQIVSYLNNLPGSDILTQRGYSINSNAFDMRGIDATRGKPNINNGDNRLDLLIIFWRVNSKFRAKRDGGIFSYGNNSYPLKNKIGSNAYSIVCTSDPGGTFKHEFAHALLGGNNFHSGGAGAGVGTYLSNMGGYSMLSSYNLNLAAYNGWDRWRLGWKPAVNNYEISARTVNNVEVNADLVYGQSLTTNEFILRDFSTYGDAIRIKLPYLKSLNSSAKEQYIWIENHQLLPDKIEYASNKPKGIRLNIQVGNDNLSTFNNSSTNSISPYSSFGNYDFSYSTTAPSTMTTSNQWKNPLTGYHLSQSHAINYIDPNVVPNKPDAYDQIFAHEYIHPRQLIFNGSRILGDYPAFGNQYDVFSTGSKMNISSNPSSAAVLTYRTGNKTDSTIPPVSNPRPEDNRYVYLNGLSIEVLSQNSNGDIRVRIKWNDFDVNSDVRWCGPIVLNEKVNLLSGNTILLDQGLTPTKPLNPIVFNGTKTFADPTVFTCKQGSLFKANSGSTIHLKNNSALVAESGSVIELDGANLMIESGATLHVKSGATLRIRNSGNILVKENGFMCIEQGANVILQDYNSVIKVEQGAVYGVNPVYSTNTTNCSSIIAYSGNGFVIDLQNVYIQNETITTNRHIVGKNIYVGNNVTNTKPPGNVIITNNANVIFDATENVFFEAGFECPQGASFEVVKQ